MADQDAEHEPHDPTESAGQVVPPAQHEVVHGIPLQPIILPGEQALSLQQVQIWQGQFPPPDAVASYEVTMPGAFNRLMSMAERQQEASIQAANDARNFLRLDNQRGHYLGFAVTFLAVLGAIICAFFKQPYVAALLVGVPVLSVATSLVESTRTKPTQGVAIQSTQPAASTPPTSETAAKP